MNDFPLVKKNLNGLNVLLLPREQVQTVTVLVLIGVGSRYETPKQSGLSHFLEHMFFKGTDKRPSAREIAEAVDEVGGEFNAFTGEEYTGYYVKVPSAQLERAMDVVSDILLHPLFPAEEIEKERGVIVEEIRMYTDMPMRHIHHLWQEGLFGEHPLGRRIDGSEETVNSFKRPDFLRYVNKHYHRGNAVVAVAGNFDEKVVINELKASFAGLPPGEETHPKAAPKRLPGKTFIHERRRHLDQTHIMVGVPGLSNRDEDKYAASLLATILGSGMSSRLFLSVRERHGLAYMVRTMTDEYTDTGAFVTQAGVRTDKAAAAVELILDEYQAVVQDGVTAAELSKAKEMARGRLVMGLEETNDIALFATGQQLLEKELLTPAEIWKKIEAVSQEEVQAVAQRLLSKQPMLALLGPQGSTKSFEKLLDKR